MPFRIPDELELLDIATDICHARLGPISGFALSGEEGKNPMMELTSDFMESKQSPPPYDEVVSSPPSVSVPHKGRNEAGEATFMKRRSVSGDASEKRQKTNTTPPMLMSASKPIISPHPQSIIDNILRASMMSSGPMMSPNLQPPFSPLSPTFPDTWPALHALMGITNAQPKIVSKNDALMGLDRFIAFVEQKPSVASILKDVLYEFKKYAMQKL